MRKVFGALLAFASVAAAQQGPPDARYAIGALDSLKLPSTVALLVAINGAATTAESRLDRAGASDVAANIRQRTQWLRGRYTGAASDPLPFRRSLAFDLAVIRAAESDTSDRRVAAVFREVSDDLTEKANHCQRSATGMAAPVAVSVRTWAGKTESPQWQIVYMPKIMEFAADPSAAVMPFRTFSSPSTEELPPGRYIIWARRPTPNGVQSERTTIRVGNGAKTLAQDIAVPE